MGGGIYWQSAMDKAEDSVRTYLKSIGKYPLLTSAEEIELAHQIQTMLHPPADLNPAELEKIQKRGQLAKQKMIRSNLRLVVALAKKYQRRGLELLDMIQEGSLGLERAAEKFDPTKGYKFSTYAYWWIRQGITRGLCNQSRTIRLPIHIIDKLNQIKRARRELSQELGRDPTQTEIAGRLGLEPELVQKIWNAARTANTGSLNVYVGDDQSTELGELLEDKQNAAPEEILGEELLQDEFKEILSELTQNQQKVLILRYGLNDGVYRSLNYVGQEMGLSRERVRQIEQSAIAKLRRSQKLKLLN
ncbi:MAG: sigma-70 family RNA polymerase sigma factor [Symploca sp. SIO2E6]|nr:sigma-70 family RNA polymerase sigma factor [Symploca sp. SIO2E6]